MSTNEEQKGRIMPREDFNLKKFKRTKEGVQITHHIGGTTPADITADVDVKPHPDLQVKMDELQLYMATRLGLLQGWDFAREGTRKDRDVLEKAIQGHKDAVSMCNINGITFVGEGETAGVMITGSIKTPKSGSVGLAVPKITFGKKVLGYENEVEQICEEITDEIYKYLILKKKEQTDIKAKDSTIKDRWISKKKKKMKKPKNKVCRNEGCENEFTPFNSIQKYCSWKCTNENKKSPKIKKTTRIRQVSKKQAVINSKYTVQRIQYLSKPENKECFVDGCRRGANTVEHTRGRGKHFFDDHAKLNNIPMTLDERFWKPCCLDHNLEFERNPELSKKYQKSKLHSGNK